MKEYADQNRFLFNCLLSTIQALNNYNHKAYIFPHYLKKSEWNINGLPTLEGFMFV